MSAQRVGIVGAGWAGLAAAVTAVRAGHAVTVFEMAGQPGGRAREVDAAQGLDNGQHVLIGAYQTTLRLMAEVGVSLDAVLWRTPLHLVDAQGRGLRLPPGAPMWAFLRAVVGHDGWAVGERWALLRHAAAWRWRGFQCEASLTVSQLTHGLPTRVRHELIDPLCVAALNTPSPEASAQVFLRVLRDALAGGSGSADLLLPRQPLSALWPRPALQWLTRHGADVRFHHPVRTLAPCGSGWQVDDEAPFEQVIVATTAWEAERLCRLIAPDWSDPAQALQHEPIATVYLNSPGTRLLAPMVRLDSDEHERPAQFVLDASHWGGPAGRLAAVVSGAAPWLARGQDALAHAIHLQLMQALGPALRSPLQTVRTLTDKRATFRCTAGLRRPPRHIAPGLQAAGDYVEGPYPATLEGAMRAGVEAARGLTSAGAKASAGTAGA